MYVTGENAVNIGTQQFTVLTLFDRWVEITPRANLRHFPDMARGYMLWFSKYLDRWFYVCMYVFVGVYFGGLNVCMYVYMYVCMYWNNPLFNPYFHSYIQFIMVSCTMRAKRSREQYASILSLWTTKTECSLIHRGYVCMYVCI